MEEAVATIVKVAIGSAVLYCAICGKQMLHYIFKSSKNYEDYQCTGCNLIEKIKVK